MMNNNYGNIPPIMNEQFRKIDSNYSNSPKSSPHGGRSPVVSRQDSSGTLKATISLGKTPTIIQTGPFYALKEPPGKGELTGERDLMTEYGLHHTLTKFKDKKLKESLASFLPNIPGIHENIDRIVCRSNYSNYCIAFVFNVLLRFCSLFFYIYLILILFFFCYFLFDSIIYIYIGK